MTKPLIALCAAQPIADGDVGAAPEWLHLLPAGPIRTRDGRGPYSVADINALMAASLGAGEKLVLDENHATDLAAPKGASAPARGWIVELQHRDDGVWGRIEWTGEGRKLAADKAYRGVSPVIAHRKDGVITRILRASLTNAPNFEGLVALHQEDSQMDLRSKLIEALGLDSEADDDAIVTAVKAKLDAGGADDGVKALQSALGGIAKAAGVAEDADAGAVLAGVQALAGKAGAGDRDEVVASLQSELADVTKRHNALSESIARKDAERFVDAAIAEGRVGVKPLRDDYIAMHMEDPARARKMIAAQPALGKGSRAGGLPPAEGKDGLDAGDSQVIALMGLDPEQYKKTRAAMAGETEEAL